MMKGDPWPMHFKHIIVLTPPYNMYYQAEYGGQELSQDEPLIERDARSRASVQPAQPLDFERDRGYGVAWIQPRTSYEYEKYRECSSYTSRRVCGGTTPGSFVGVSSGVTGWYRFAGSLAAGCRARGANCGAPTSGQCACRCGMSANRVGLILSSNLSHRAAVRPPDGCFLL